MARKEKEWRKVKSIPAMSQIVPFIMVNRTGAMNMVRDSFESSKVEKYIKEKQAEGMQNLSLMHVMIAAYIRIVAQRPALNRFIRGQRIWTRKNVEIALTIKKEMTLESPDTVVKVTLPKNATLRDVYEALNAEIVNYRNDPSGDFEDTVNILSRIPALVMKFVIHLLKTMDYFGLIPKFLLKVSPFHCSYFITSMGSLGIPPIFHHLYDFGTCPVFCAFGTKRREYEMDAEGTVKKKSYIDFTYVLDERICDGYYYASALRILKNIMKNPWQLDEVPEVVEDIK
ncbi:MAG: hypothetical protein E7627_05235 [Ruminococcaceae bacterium]|nr:hypothetical protein [Oscillospiraceae bacterium]